MATLLILAFPVVPNEDPGLIESNSHPAGMLLTLLWLVAAAGWAGWRLVRSRLLETLPGQDQPSEIAAVDACHAGAVETGLLILLVLVSISAWTAAYRYPAALIAWSWLGLLAVLFVVRQLAVTPAERRCLFAVLLASAVALSAQALYEREIQLPRLRQVYGTDADSLRKVWEGRDPGRSISDPYLDRLRQRIEQTDARATFVHSDTLASFLALCLPGLGLACVCCHRQGSPRWLTATLAGWALLTALALWLTFSFGAIFTTLLTCLLLALFHGRHALRRHLGVAALSLLVLGGLGLAAFRGGMLETSRERVEEMLRQRQLSWQIACRMIHDHTWLGVGPGGFASHATRYLPPEAPGPISGADNLVLETAAASGLLAAGVLLAALAWFFVEVVRSSRQAPAHQDESTEAPTPPLRVEFYIGGSLGLLLSFILRATPLVPEEIIPEAFSAGLRSVVWFMAFATLERLVWTAPLRKMALTAGVAALLGSLFLTEGISFPAVAGPLWIAVGLALNTTSLRPCGWLSRPGPGRLLTFPVLTALALIFGVLVCIPVHSSYSLQQAALQKGRVYEAKVSLLRTERRLNLVDDVLQDLKEAADLTPGDARLHVYRANWLLRRWAASPLQETFQQAADEALAAQKLDPLGWAGYQMEYELHLLRASRLRWQLRHRPPPVEQERARQHTEARRHFEEAAQALVRHLPDDPNNALLHYLLAAALFDAGHTEEGRKQALQAQQLDALVPGPGRKLADRQQKKIQQWLEEGSGS